jgi:HAD superfamily hydrolase (TIGR01509 family)
VPDSDPVKDLALYRAHHPSVLRSGTLLLPGVLETLTALLTAGFNLAVCSNKPRPFTVTLVDFLGLAPLLKVVIGPEDAPRLKPAPDMLIAALAQLSVARDEALYVGDMTVDIETARAAGVTVWSVPTGSDTEEALIAAQPDRLLHRFSDLLELRTQQRQV